jgi:uncharacterized protein YpmS
VKKKMALVAALAALVSGCAGGFVRSQAESGIRDALPTYIGPAKNYTVAVDGSASGIINGHMRHVRIEGTDVQIDPKLTVAQIVIDMDDVHYNHKRQITRIGSTLFKASVTEAMVNHFAEQGQAKEYKAKATLTDGSVKVDCVARLLGAGMPVSFTGKPQIAHGNKINFVVDSASAAHLSIPAAIANKILDRVNPIIDMSTMKFPVTLDTISVKQGSIDVSGKAEIKMPPSAVH